MIDFRISIERKKKPSALEINQELQWFGHSLGLFTERDKDKSCFRIFIELVQATKKEIPISSDELAFRLKLTRGTIVHHLNRLMIAGIVSTERNKYILRSDSLTQIVEDIRKDVQETLNEIKEVAKDIEKKL